MTEMSVKMRFWKQEGRILGNQRVNHSNKSYHIKENQEIRYTIVIKENHRR